MSLTMRVRPLKPGPPRPRSRRSRQVPSVNCHHGQCLEAATCPVPSPAFGSSHHSCFPASTPETGQEGGHSFPDSRVKSQLEEKENKKYPTFKATEYKSQVVQGTNYFIKVQVADDDFVHLCVFQSLPQENKALALHNYQTNKTKQDELDYF
ncbi:cystatin-B-like [Myotis lucifugus]|uniref:cystatin-B-like n=1 Tax=Myotis lucifugus TaxID=59463 RepID=UPI000CCC770C|nr:cystatin-B-like [Myotis lucifugus]